MMTNEVSLPQRRFTSLQQQHAERRDFLDMHQRKAGIYKLGPRSPMPPLFESSGRTELLSILSANGPMTVREVARARGVDSASTFRTSERLIRCGLVVKRSRSGGRKYLALNRAHCAYRELSNLLTVLVDHHGTAFIDQARYRHGLPVDRDPTPPLAEERMFGSDIRSRLIVLLAALNEADATQLTRLLTADRCSVYYAAHALKRRGILNSKSVGARNVFSFNLDYVGAVEYQVFLKKLLESAPVYSILRSLVAGITLRYR